MAILFAASEAEAFTLTTTAQQFARAGEIDTDFARASAGVALSSTALLATPVFTAQTELWVQVYTAWNSLTANTTQPSIMLKDTGGGTIAFQIDSDNPGNINAEYWNGAAYVEVGAADVVVNATNPHMITIHVKIDNTVGVFDVWLDDVLTFSFHGDTLNTGYTQIDQVILGSASSGTGTGSSTTHSELIVSTTPTWGYRVATKAPTGNSATNTAWTGAFGDIDDLGIVNDVDLITDNVNADTETYTCAALPTGPNTMVPIAVVTAIRAQNSGSGIANIKHCIRRSGTNYTGSNVSGLSTTLAPYIEVWATDPSTSSAWTVSGIDAAEFGVQAAT